MSAHARVSSDDNNSNSEPNVSIRLLLLLIEFLMTVLMTKSQQKNKRKKDKLGHESPFVISPTLFPKRLIQLLTRCLKLSQVTHVAIFQQRLHMEYISLS
jgi:hypothetical protein